MNSPYWVERRKREQKEKEDALVSNSVQENKQ